MDFNILECRNFVAPASKVIIKRTVYDYELDFHITGDRIITVDGNENIFRKGDISIRKPGQTVFSTGDYNCYILTLDFSCKKSRVRYSRNTVGEIQSLCNDSIASYLPPKVTPSSSMDLAILFEKLCRLSDFDSTIAKNLVKQILYTINIDALKAENSEQTDKKVVDIVYRYIRENFTKEITLEMLANYAHLDKSYMCRTFKKKFGISPVECVIRHRLEYARELALNTDMTVSQISQYCGYSNTSFFISCYKKQYGTTPRQDRNRFYKDNGVFSRM